MPVDIYEAAVDKKNALLSRISGAEKMLEFLLVRGNNQNNQELLDIMTQIQLIKKNTESLVIDHQTTKSPQECRVYFDLQSQQFDAIYLTNLSNSSIDKQESGAIRKEEESMTTKEDYIVTKKEPYYMFICNGWGSGGPWYLDLYWCSKSLELLLKTVKISKVGGSDFDYMTLDFDDLPIYQVLLHKELANDVCMTNGGNILKKLDFSYKTYYRNLDANRQRQLAIELVSKHASNLVCLLCDVRGNRQFIDQATSINPKLKNYLHFSRTSKKHFNK